jgi:hypothetical protein
MAKQDRYSSTSPRDDGGDREDFKGAAGASEYDTDRDRMGEYPESDEDLPRASGLGKEIKIGLTVITILLVVLGAVVAVKLRGSQDEPVADAEADTPGKAAAHEPASGGLKTKPEATEVKATPSTGITPLSTRPPLEDGNKGIPKNRSSVQDDRGPRVPSLFDAPPASESMATDRYGDASGAGRPSRGAGPWQRGAAEEPIAGASAQDLNPFPKGPASANPLRQPELPDPPSVGGPAWPLPSTNRQSPAGPTIATRPPAGAAAATPRGTDLSGGLSSLSGSAGLDRGPAPPMGTPWRDRAPDPLAASKTPGPLTGATGVLPPTTPRSGRDPDAGRQPNATWPGTSGRAAGGRVYVAREGDTLYDVAKFELGKVGRWAEIYELNRDTVRNQFDYLTPGTKLILPDGGTGAGNLTRRPGSGFNR